MNAVRLGICLSVATALALPLAAQEYETIDGRLAVANEVLVKFRSGGTTRMGAQMMREHSIVRSRGLGRDGFTHLRSVGKKASQLIRELAADPDVLYVEPNYVVSTTAVPNDSYFSSEWALQNTGQNGGMAKADIDAVRAWDITKGSRTNVVGVVDTGIDYNHPDLSANVWSAPSSFTVTFGTGDSITCPAGSHGYDAVTNTCDPRDQNNHGTHVAGTIGASGNNGSGVTGVNWTASILGLRFMDSTGKGTVANAIRAIEFAIQLKAKFPTQAKVTVLSNSWGGSGYSQALLNEINRANQAGILFVVASGNEGVNLNATPSYPASYRTPNIITVAATDNMDGLASFSNYGTAAVDLGAPGVGIVSTLPSSSYGTGSGTSMATPHVSGAAALVLSACTLDTAGLRKTLLDNVDAVTSLVGRTVTGGRLNVYRAISSCAGKTVTPSFALGASPVSLTVAPGGTATSTISVASSGGFSGSVSLSVSGLPAGVTASITPAVVAPGGRATLVLTAGSAAAAASATVTVTGTSGTLKSTAAVAVTVKAPAGFTLTVTPPSITVRPGGMATYSVALGTAGGFSGTVSIRLTGAPTNSAVSFFSTGSGKATLRINTTTRTALGTYTLTLAGTSGSLAQTATATLIVAK